MKAVRIVFIAGATLIGLASCAVVGVSEYARFKFSQPTCKCEFPKGEQNQ